MSIYPPGTNPHALEGERVPDSWTEIPVSMTVPVEPTRAMLEAARDWSIKKYGKPIGDDAARGCWEAMRSAAMSAK